MQPDILCTAGLQDREPYRILEQNRKFRDAMKQIGPAKYTYLEWDGVHEWNFWDRSLVYAIDRFINPGYAAKKLGDWAAPAKEE